MLRPASIGRVDRSTNSRLHYHLVVPRGRGLPLYLAQMQFEDSPMADFSIATALGLLRRTAPFVLFRVVVYGGMAAAYVLASVAGAILALFAGLWLARSLA